MKRVKTMRQYRANLWDLAECLGTLFLEGIMGVGLLVFVVAITIPTTVAALLGFYPNEEGHCDGQD